MVDQAFLTQAKSLGVTERLELISALWESIDADALPISTAEAQLIDERLVEANSDPLVGQAWEEVRESLRSRAS